jgi:hypothetical protein
MCISSSIPKLRIKWPTSDVPTSLPHPPYLKDYRIVSVGAGMGGNVLVIFKPGKVGPIAHGKHLGEKAIEGAKANPTLNSLSIKDNGVTHLVAKFATPFLAGHPGRDFVTSVFKNLMMFLFHRDYLLLYSKSVMDKNYLF